MTDKELWQKAVDGAIAARDSAGMTLNYRKAFDKLRVAFQANVDSFVTEPGVELLPYIDPAALSVPWPKHSHYKQPWRGWARTASAVTLRDAIGLNYPWQEMNRDHSLDLARYAEAGVKRIRVEYSYNAWYINPTTEVWNLLSWANQYGIHVNLLMGAGPDQEPWYDMPRWLDYVQEVCDGVFAVIGPDGWNVELWNEFWKQPPDAPGTQPGGTIYEFAKDTAALIHTISPTTEIIWGFSNANFFGAAINDLPPGFVGQTYHPYYFVNYNGPADDQYGIVNNLEGYAPQYKVCMPEGSLTFLKTESLARLLEPAARQQQPAGFKHYMTEHGVHPLELGVTDIVASDRMKIVSTLRTLVSFVHAGMEGIYFYASKTLDGRVDPHGGFDLDPVALPAIARLADILEEVEPAPALDIQIETALPGEGFPGDATHPGLPMRDILAVLPFQVTSSQLGVAVYVMTRDLRVPLPNTTARIRISGTAASPTGAIDLFSGVAVGVNVIEKTPTSVTFEMSVTDSPRWVVIQ